jgi:hypothetical protein
MTIRTNNRHNYYGEWKGIRYASTSRFDQIAGCIGQKSPRYRPTGTFTILGNQIQARLYASPAICDPYTPTVLQYRLSRHYTVASRPARTAENAGLEKSATLHHHSKSPAAAVKKRAWHRLQAAIFAYAKAAGLIKPATEASIDSTGLESRFVSRHFLIRQGKRTHRYRKWTKLTIVADNASHLIAGAGVSIGPSNDSPLLPNAVRQAAEHICIDCLLADAGYDAESNHEICRNELDIRSTVIPVNSRSRKEGQTTGHYRNQMKQKFPMETFGQRWQVESIFSRFKRRLGYALRAKLDQSRATECLVRVLTYNLMILYLLVKYGFYGALSNLKLLPLQSKILVKPPLFYADLPAMEPF